VLSSWKQQWQSEVVPQLHITKVSESDYILYDSRGIAGTREVEFIDAEQAFVSLWGARGASSRAVEWAMRRSACLEIEDEVVPLATADPILIHALQASFGGLVRIVEGESSANFSRTKPMGMVLLGQIRRPGKNGRSGFRVSRKCRIF